MQCFVDWDKTLRIVTSVVIGLEHCVARRDKVYVDAHYAMPLVVRPPAGGCLNGLADGFHLIDGAVAHDGDTFIGECGTAGHPYRRGQHRLAAHIVAEATVQTILGNRQVGAAVGV